MVNRGGQMTVSKEQMEERAAQYLKQFKRLLQKSEVLQCSIGVWEKDMEPTGSLKLLLRWLTLPVM